MCLSRFVYAAKEVARLSEGCWYFSQGLRLCIIVRQEAKWLVIKTPKTHCLGSDMPCTN